MKPLVYIETTIPSYYCDNRPKLAQQIARTQQWWDQERNRYECYVAPVVLDELSAGNHPNRAACLSLVENITLLNLIPEVLEIAEEYQRHRLMPRPPVADALHVALASYYRMDYLLTWNCRHIANVHKARHLQVLNHRMGLSVPQLVTPDYLQLPEDES